VLTGSAVALARWATGRGHAGVSAVGGADVPIAPRWL
jgi:maleylpyruvate isomerase